MGFPRREYWSWLPFPSPGELSNPGMKPASPTLAVGYFFYHWTIWEAPTYTHNKILKERGIQDHFTCLLWNLYAGQDATLRNRHGITDWFKIGEGVHQGCILSPCLFNIYAEYILRNARLNEAQAGIKIAGRTINNLWYADDTTLTAESEEEL